MSNGGLFEQIFRMPITFFNSGMGILNQTMRGAQSMGDTRGGGAGSTTRSGSGAADSRIEIRGEAGTREGRGRDKGDAEVRMRYTDDSRERQSQESGRDRDRNRDRDCDRDRDYGSERGRGRSEDGGSRGDEGGRREGRWQSGGRDRDLSGDRLKLVRYKVLFIKRDYEVAFPEREELVADDLSATDFTAWKIAEFIQRLGEEEVPRQWRQRNYPRDSRDEQRPVIRHLHEEDKKYLRVYFEVLARYDREEFHHEERQVEVLEEIRDVLRNS